MTQVAIVDDGLEEFERFWAAYPKRPINPKRPALLEFQRLRKAGALPDIEQLLLALTRYKAQLLKDKTEPSFIAHTRTWLHQRRWEGLTDPPKQAAASIANERLIVPLGCSEETALAFARIHGKAAWSIWFGDTQWLDQGNRVVVMVKSRFERDQLEGRHMQYVSNLELITGKRVDIRLPSDAR